MKSKTAKRTVTSVFAYVILILLSLFIVIPINRLSAKGTDVA